MSRCVDCGAVIGGENHEPVQGFQHLPNQYGMQTFEEKHNLKMNRIRFSQAQICSLFTILKGAIALSQAIFLETPGTGTIPT